MNIQITKPIQGGTIKAIASKSEAHRLLICAALSGCESFIELAETSEDIEATLRCLTTLGAVAEIKQAAQTTFSGIYITPINRITLKNATSEGKTYILDCGESGATLRFMLPVCGALGINAQFHMSGRLPSRPLSALYNEMTSHGYTLSAQGVSPLNCNGQLQSGTYTLPGNISSQYISGLLLALPFLADEIGESLIQITSSLESRPYVDMTIDAMRLFGAQVYEDSPNTFRIPGNQKTHPAKKLQVGGDWSNAAFWLSAGAIGNHSITCTGLDLNSKQGDKAICEILEQFGANVLKSESSVTVSPGKLHGIEIDAENTPDLVPILAAVASVSEGQTVIKNAGRLRIKESDRLHTVTEMLTGVGADVIETEDGLIITGKKPLIGGNATLSGGVIHSHNDHRIAMTAAILASVCTNPVEIIGADAINKSYPGFFEDFKALGGEFEMKHIGMQRKMMLG